MKSIIGEGRNFVRLESGHYTPTFQLVIKNKKIYQVQLLKGVNTPTGWKKANLEVYDGEYFNFFVEGKKVEESDLCDKYIVNDVTEQIQPLINCNIESPYFQGISLDDFRECKDEAILEAIAAYEKA